MTAPEPQEPAELQGEAWHMDVLVRTAQALADPQPGDGFHDTWTRWLFVVAVQPYGGVDVLTLTVPERPPADGTLVRYGSAADLRRALTDDTGLSYCVQLVDRLGPASVAGWLEHHIEETP